MKCQLCAAPSISGKKQAEVIEKSLLGLVLPLWGHDYPFALRLLPRPNISTLLVGQRRQYPRPSCCQEWFLTFFGSGPTENYGTSQDGDRGWGKHILKALQNFQETKDLKHTPHCKIINSMAKTLDLGQLNRERSSDAKSRP